MSAQVFENRPFSLKSFTHLVALGATALALAGCPGGGTGSDCPSATGTLVFQNQTDESVQISIEDESGELPGFLLEPSSTSDEELPVGDYEVTAEGTGSGRTYLRNSYSVSCGATTSITIEPPARFELSVTLSGMGLGTVLSSPAGIDCDSTDPSKACSARFDSGTQITLDAISDDSSEFLGWSGACEGNGSCVVTLTQARNVGAQFVPKLDTFAVTLSGNGQGTVSSEPAGIICSNAVTNPAMDCSTDYEHGTAVVLTAVPEAGSEFSGWSGEECAGSDDSCELTVSGPVSVSARFSLLRYPLEVSLSGNGSGTVTSAPGSIDCGEGDGSCSESFDFGTSVTLTAAPLSGSRFAGWSGGACEGTELTCVVDVTTAHEVTASFAEVELTAPAVDLIQLGQARQGQVQAQGLDYYIATTGVFPSRTTVNVSGSPMIGQIMLFAAGFAPAGWARCDGSLLPISTFTALFSILGTTYGGDGISTFRLPDLRARVPMGPGSLPGHLVPPVVPGIPLVPTVSSISRGGSALGQVSAVGINYYIAVSTSFTYPVRDGAEGSTAPYIGQIMLFAGNFAPAGWALCDGSRIPISQNQALFSIFATTYGGDGKTNFALPDLRARVPMGVGSRQLEVIPPTSSQVPLIPAISQGATATGQVGVLGLNILIAHEGAFPSPSSASSSYGHFRGQVMFFAGNFAPSGWSACDGSERQIEDHPTLYSLLANTYGGDGESTFAVPDLRARVPMGSGSR